MLILGEAHLRTVLAGYQVHYNTARRTRASPSASPTANTTVATSAVAGLDRERIHRKPVLGGLINEYSRAA